MFKVTDQGQMENSFPEQNFHTQLCQIGMSLGRSVHHNKTMCTINVIEVCALKVKVTNQGQMENIFLVHRRFLFFAQISYHSHMAQVSAVTRKYITYVDQVSMAKVKVTSSDCVICVFKILLCRKVIFIGTDMFYEMCAHHHHRFLDIQLVDSSV